MSFAQAQIWTSSACAKAYFHFLPILADAHAARVFSTVLVISNAQHLCIAEHVSIANQSCSVTQLAGIVCAQVHVPCFSFHSEFQTIACEQNTSKF